VGWALDDHGCAEGGGATRWHIGDLGSNKALWDGVWTVEHRAGMKSTSPRDVRVVSAFAPYSPICYPIRMHISPIEP
jgi:hypothetical protein